MDIKPTGTCWCGCGGATKEGKYFIPSHDRKAELAVIKLWYGTIAHVWAHHGFSDTGHNATKELKAVKRRSE